MVDKNSPMDSEARSRSGPSIPTQAARTAEDGDPSPTEQ